jgi:hypothetical protein
MVKQGKSANCTNNRSLTKSAASFNQHNQGLKSHTINKKKSCFNLYLTDEMWLLRPDSMKTANCRASGYLNAS